MFQALLISIIYIPFYKKHAHCPVCQGVTRNRLFKLRSWKTCIDSYYSIELIKSSHSPASQWPECQYKTIKLIKTKKAKDKKVIHKKDKRQDKRLGKRQFKRQGKRQNKRQDKILNKIQDKRQGKDKTRQHPPKGKTKKEGKRQEKRQDKKSMTDELLNLDLQSCCLCLW